MRILLLAPILLALAVPAFAEDSPIHVADAKARPTAPGGTGVVYMIVMNHGAADDDLTALSTPIAPPMISTNRFVMARPSPDPPRARVIDSSTCWKDSKIWECFSGAMPMPVSVTAQAIVTWS